MFRFVFVALFLLIIISFKSNYELGVSVLAALQRSTKRSAITIPTRMSHAKILCLPPDPSFLYMLEKKLPQSLSAGSAMPTGDKSCGITPRMSYLAVIEHIRYLTWSGARYLAMRTAQPSGDLEY
jgi:hypothetical protein